MRQRQRCGAAGSRLALLLVTGMLLLPVASATTSVYIGPTIVSTSGSSNVTGWEVPANGTLLEGWVSASTPVMTDAGAGEWWTGASRPGNFSVGTSSNLSVDGLSEALRLDFAPGTGLQESFETLVYNLPSGVSTNSVGASWGAALLGTATSTQPPSKQVGSGWGPSAASTGSASVTTSPGGDLASGSDAILEFDPVLLNSANKNDTRFSFDIAHHFRTTSNTNGGGDGAWVEVTFDNGTTWQYVHPVSGYTNTIDSSAIAPSGASSGFGVWSSVNFTNWQHVEFELSNITVPTNASYAAFRVRAWTLPGTTVLRPGAWVDNVSISTGSKPGSWFAGNRIGAYNGNLDASLVIPMNLSSASGALTLGIASWWDLEGSSFDNFVISVSNSTSNINNATGWTSLSTDIPSSGVTFNGTTYGADSGGWVWLSYSLPSGFAGDPTTWLRVRLYSDFIIGCGGVCDGWEGVFFDDFVVANTSAVFISDPFGSIGNATHSVVTGNTAGDPWVRANDFGRGLVDTKVWDFDNLYASAPGWQISTTGISGWEIGTPSSTYGPSVAPTGAALVGTVIDGNYDNSGEASLKSPTISVPVGGTATLSFDHWMCSESNYDYGTIYIESNTTAKVNPAGPVGFWDNTRPATSSAHPGSGIFEGPGQGVCPSSTAWVSKTLELTGFGGQDINAEFIFWADGSITYDGWYLDDISLAVNEYVESGSWRSPVLTVPDLGLGWVGAEAEIPNGTWVTATIIDAQSSLPVGGFVNRTLPLSLAGLDQDLYSQIYLDLELGTDVSSATPLVRNLSVGVDRWLAPDSTHGWTLPATVQFDNSTGDLNNTGASPATLVSDYVFTSRPVHSVDVTTMTNTLVTKVVDDSGNALGQRTGPGRITLKEPSPGYSLHLTLPSSVHLSTVEVIGHFHEPALDPSLDIGDDGVMDWFFDSTPSYGHLGWQNRWHATVDATGVATNVSSATTSIPVVTGAGAAAGGVALLPVGATTVRSGWFSVDGTLSPGDNLTMEINGVNVAQFSATDLPAIVTLTSAPLLSALLNLPVVHTDGFGNGFVEVDLMASTSQPAGLRFTSFGLAYDFSTNVSTIASAADAGRVNSTDPNPIPLGINGGGGRISLDGAIEHETLIVDRIVGLPSTMVPNRNLFTVTTTHAHLFDADAIQSISLTASMASGDDVMFELGSPHLGDSGFAQSAGQEFMQLDSSSSVTSGPSAIGVRAVTMYTVDWNLTIPWTSDDQSTISWSAQSWSTSGDTVEPTLKIHGTPRYPAIENDVQVGSVSLFNSAGFDLTSEVDAFHASIGQTFDFAGIIGFEGQPDLRPHPDDVKVGISILEHVDLMEVAANGTWSGTATIPEVLSGGEGQEYSMVPFIMDIGGLPENSGANDVTSSEHARPFILDESPPELIGITLFDGGSELSADGYVWNPARTLDLTVTVHDDLALGSWLRFYHHAQSSEDDVPTGIDDYTLIERDISRAGRPGEVELVFTDLPVADVPFNGRLSIVIEMVDQAGISLLPNSDFDWDGDHATVFIATNEPTIVDDASSSITTTNGWLAAGEPLNLSIVVEDLNGIDSLDEMTLALAGNLGNSNAGLVRVVPISDTVTALADSGVHIHSHRFISQSEDVSVLEIEFSLDWNIDVEDEMTYTPTLSIIDTGSDPIGPLKMNALQWKLDRTLTVTDMSFELLGGGQVAIDEGLLVARPGARFSSSANLVFAHSGIPAEHLSEEHILRMSLSYPGDSLKVEMSADDAGCDSCRIGILQVHNYSMDAPVPIGYTMMSRPDPSTLFRPPVELLLFVDDQAPVLTINLVDRKAVQSELLDELAIDLVVQENGRMPLTLQLMTRFVDAQGTPLANESVRVHEIQLDVAASGSQYVYSSVLDLSPLTPLKNGDQIAFWVAGEDAAGWPLAGQIGISEFSPLIVPIDIASWIVDVTFDQLDPLAPVAGQTVRITAVVEMVGTRGGEVNVSLVEESSIVLSSFVFEMSPDDLSRVTIEFDYDTQFVGTPNLDVFVEHADGSNQTFTVPSFTAAKPSSREASSSASASVPTIIGLVAIVLFVLAGLIVVVLRQGRDSDSMWAEEADFTSQYDWDGSDSVDTSEIDSIPAAEPAVTPVDTLAQAPVSMPDSPSPYAEQIAALAGRTSLSDDNIVRFIESGWTVDQIAQYYPPDGST